jgi:hypothetical protein
MMKWNPLVQPQSSELFLNGKRSSPWFMTSPNLPAAEQLEQVTGPSLNAELSAMAP